jgi:hypothetical protein
MKITRQERLMTTSLYYDRLAQQVEMGSPRERHPLTSTRRGTTGQFGQIVLFLAGA